MIPVRGCKRFARRDAPRAGRLDHAGGCFRARRAHSSLRRDQLSPRHLEDGQREQCVQLRGVLRQAPVSHLHMTELALDHPERVLDLGADDSCVVSLLDALVAGIGEHARFLSVHQRLRLGHVVDVGRGADHGVNPAAVGVDTDVALHAEVPLVALLGLVHLGIARARVVLRRTGRGDQRGVHSRSFLEHQPLGRQRGVHRFKHLRCQLVLLQKVPKAQDAHAVGKAVHAAQARELAVQRHCEQRLFHRHVRQPEPLLKQVNAQHDLGTERRTSSLLARRVRLDQREQLRPRHHALHLVEELTLVALAAGQIQPEVGLLHASIVPPALTRRQGCGGSF